MQRTYVYAKSSSSIDIVLVDYKVDATDLRLSGLEAFTFDYVVKWPVSLIISRKVRLLFSVNFPLSNAWFPPFRCRSAIAVSPLPLHKFRKNYISTVGITLPM